VRYKTLKALSSKTADNGERAYRLLRHAGIQLDSYRKHKIAVVAAGFSSLNLAPNESAERAGGLIP